MIKAIGLDDEPLALEVLKQLCTSIPELDLVAIFTKATEAFNYLEAHPIDLLLLDINMPGISGLDFYQSLKKPPMLILTTAYQEYAVNAFELNAVDYLLKPFTPERLQQAILKVKAKLKVNAAAPEQDYLWLKSDSGHVKMAFGGILWIESLDNYIKVHTENGMPKLIRMTMKTIQNNLPQAQFIRVHRSYLVAVDKIQQISSVEVQVGGTKIAIGSLYKKEVLDLINKRKR